MNTESDFSLNSFEKYCYNREHENGAQALIKLLLLLDKNYGLLDDCLELSQNVAIQNHEQHILIRITSAISTLLSDSSLVLAPEYQANILSLHRWFGALFAATPFRNADHIISVLNIANATTDLENLELKNDDLLKFCLLFSSESQIKLNLDALWGSNKTLAVSLGMVLITPRFLGSTLAHNKREQLLPWLTQKLPLIEDIDLLPVAVLHDLYMHCSYADRRDKHDIKQSINILIRRKLEKCGVYDNPIMKKNKKKPIKPVIVVLVEWFTSNHSIYRTHSLSLEGMEKKFELIGMGYEECVDNVSKKVFKEFIAIDINMSIIEQMKFIQNIIQKSSAHVFYMPSVGMFPITMWCSNLRFATLQMMALGHPATTHSDKIDLVIVEEDYVGNSECFSEELLIVPSNGIPYRPSSAFNFEKSFVFKNNTTPEVVRIALCATSMKLNPNFLETCAAILKLSLVPIHFEFLIGQAKGIVYPNIQSVVKNYLGDHATVYPHQNYEAYMNIVAKCDMFLNPFPFGNTNGIMDTVSVGLLGVCKTGEEVHEHIDEGIFRRLKFPTWCITHSNEEYVNSALRLIHNHDERISLSKRLSGFEKLNIMFEGNKEIMGELVYHQLVNKKIKI